MSAPSYWGTAAAAALLAAAPLVVFLTGNAYPLASPEAGALLAACVAAGAVLGLSAFLGATAAALLLGAGAVLALYLLFGLQSSKAALVLVPLACLVLRRHIALIITATLCVLLLAMLVPRTAFARSDRPVILHLVLDEHIGPKVSRASCPKAPPLRAGSPTPGSATASAYTPAPTRNISTRATRSPIS